MSLKTAGCTLNLTASHTFSFESCVLWYTALPITDAAVYRIALLALYWLSCSDILHNELLIEQKWTEIPSGGKCRYSEQTDVSAMIAQMDTYLVDHNGVSKRPMNLAMFLFALEHVARICRVLRQPGAHALLVGVGGSGRQSLARLAAFVNSMSVFQVHHSR